MHYKEHDTNITYVKPSTTSLNLDHSINYSDWNITLENDILISGKIVILDVAINIHASWIYLGNLEQQILGAEE